MPGDAIHVVVAVATFRRPDCLARVLPQLLEQVDGLERSGVGTAWVVVVDNDPAAGASSFVSSMDRSTVRYVHEPLPGIAAARNRALDESAGADVIVFVDDDEEPTPGWLHLLVRHWSKWRCAAVTGPVRAVFDGDTPEPWVLSSGVFDRRTRRTGQDLRGAASNNLLLDLAYLRSVGLRFDEAYGLTGGSDTRLTHDITRRGGIIRWVDEAEVLDHIPASRATRSWVLKRSLRTSNDWSRVALDLAGGRRARAGIRADLTARALVRLLRGLRRWLVGLVRADVGRRARGHVEVVEAVGMLSGAYGHVAREYGRPAAHTPSDAAIVTSEATGGAVEGR